MTQCVLIVYKITICKIEIGNTTRHIDRTDANNRDYLNIHNGMAQLNENLLGYLGLGILGCSIGSPSGGPQEFRGKNSSKPRQF